MFSCIKLSTEYKYIFVYKIIFWNIFTIENLPFLCVSTVNCGFAQTKNVFWDVRNIPESHKSAFYTKLKIVFEIL